MLLEVMNKESNNYIANIVARVSAKMSGNDGSYVAAGEFLSSVVGSLDNTDSAAARFVDGSGLSRKNMITARSVVGVLRELYVVWPEQTRQVLRRSPTKRLPGGGTLPVAYTKTGSMDGIRTLSGILVGAGRPPIAFSIIMNSLAADQAVATDTIQRALAALMRAGIGSVSETETWARPGTFN